jgi:hypothetical protein
MLLSRDVCASMMGEADGEDFVNQFWKSFSISRARWIYSFDMI